MKAIAALVAGLVLCVGAADQQAATASDPQQRLAAETFWDGDFDTNFSGGPDLRAVGVYDDRGKIQMNFLFANRGCLQSNEEIYIYIDSETSWAGQSLGSPNVFGADFYLSYSQQGMQIERWSGSGAAGKGGIGWTQMASPPAATGRCENGTEQIELDAEGFYIGSSFRFAVGVLQSGSVSDRSTAFFGGAPPWEYVLAAEPPSPPPPEVPEATYRDAPNLPASNRFTGASIKHRKIGGIMYRAARMVGMKGVVSAACWSSDDWPSVADHPSYQRVLGFWAPRLPGWIHLNPRQCAPVQKFLDTRRPSAVAAYGLTTIMHERLHAEGVENEAMANCYGTQYVWLFVRAMGLPVATAYRMERLAVTTTRRSAPRGYWNAGKCRDGGAWDAEPEVDTLG